MSLEWHHIRISHDSRYDAFEKLCCDLAEREAVPDGAEFFALGAPDAGVECFWRLPDGSAWAWQAKFFTSPPTNNQWGELDDSVKTALDKRPSLTKYTICLPIDPPDPRIPGRKSLTDKWNDHVQKWEQWAHLRSMQVEFVYWGEHQIRNRLIKHQDILDFWFPSPTDAKIHPDRVFLAPPLPPNTLVGRTDQICTLQQFLLSSDTQECIALIGLPGVGKSTLAAALAWEQSVLGHFSGGILWAGLGPNPSVDEIVRRWEIGLDMDSTYGGTVEARVHRIQAALGNRVILIILDDIWNVDVAILLSRVTGPGCKRIITTRDETIARAFTLPANIIRIPELSELESIHMLEGICIGIPIDSASIHKIARMSGGLPLALRLLGSYLAENITFSVEVPSISQVIMDLESRLALRDRERQLTLKEIINLSIDALPNKAVRDAFIALGVFAPKPATFSLEAAQLVIGNNAATLAVLVRRNLLEVVDETRLTLHQSLADVAKSHLNMNNTVFLVYANYYLDLAKNWQNQSVTLLLELPQVRHILNAANDEMLLAFTLSLRGFYRLQGLWDDGIRGIERGLQATRNLRLHRDEGLLLNELGLTYEEQGNLHKALEYYVQALPILESTNDNGLSSVLNNIGTVYLYQNQLEKALDYLDRALQKRESWDDPQAVASMLNNIGMIYEVQKQWRLSLEYLKSALGVNRKAQYKLGEARSLSNIGGVCQRLLLRKHALRYFKLALALHVSTGDKVGQSATLRHMADIYAELGRQKRAIAYYEEVAVLYE